jgi:hypothetical protein
VSQTRRAKEYAEANYRALGEEDAGLKQEERSLDGALQDATELGLTTEEVLAEATALLAEVTQPY